MAKLTPEERAEIRAMFQRMANLQADDIIRRVEAGQIRQFQVDTGEEVWNYFGGGDE
jgi:hypothetical protein